MKKILRLFQFILCCLCLLPAGNAFAQLVAGESFLKGDYVEVGVAINGAYGTNNPAPAGYHGRAPGPELGFVSDPDKDGWTVGTPNYCGDYFLPGVPQEGWDIQVGGAWGKAWRDGSGGGGTGFIGAITGTNVDYSSAGGIFKNTWVGAFSGVAIKQQTILKKDKLYFIIKVTLRNTTAATIKEIYYDRTLDPDNTSLMGGLPGVVTSPGPTTVNLIEYKLPNPESRTLVSAVSTLTIEKDKDGGGKDTVDYPVYLGIGSKDCRSRPYILGGTLMPLAADSPSRLYRNDATLPATYLFNLGQTNTADAATGLVFHIDSLKPGDSTSFFMAYVLSTADLDTAFKDMSPTFDFDGKEYQSGDTVKICRSSSAPDERKKLDILGGEDYTWTWVPRPGLENTTGTKNSIVVTNTPTTYVVKPSEGFGCVDSMTITIMPYINPVGPSAPSPLFYCQHEKAPPMTASTGGAGVFRWYTTPVGGVGVPSMIPATNVPGLRVYYVSVLNGICESDRTPVTVITRKLPTVDGFTEKAPSACAAKDGTINFRVDSANKPYTVFYDKDGEAQTPVVFTSDATGRFTLTGLGGGSYGAFYVIDQYGCKSLPFYGPVDLIDPVPAGPPIVNNGPLCVGGKLELTAPFLDGVTYKWTGPNGFSSTDRSPELEDVTEASGGDYVLIVTKGTCVYRASRTTLEIAPTPKHQQFSPKALCEGTDLKVELLREPGTSYAWTGHGVNQFDQDLLVSPVSLEHSGYYLVTATSGVGCITLDSVEVRVDKKQTVSYGGDTSICSGDFAQLFVQTDGADVLWSPAGSLDNATALTPKASPTTKTEYQVVAHSGTTCPDITGKVSVDVIPAPSVRAYDTLVRMDVPYTIMPVYGQDAVKWHWEPADNLSCSDCPNPVFTSRNDMTYTVYVSNNLGCTSADTVTIRVFCDGASVTMPNAFTPNGDGKNDLYYVRGKGFAVKRFIIYNRLGQEVFHKENFLPNDKNYGWDGTLSGTQITEAAGFVYMLEVQCYGSTNEPMVMKGTVLLIR